MRCRIDGVRPGWMFARAWLLWLGTAGSFSITTAQDAPGDGSPTVEVVEVFFAEEAARLLGKQGSWLPVYVELKARTSQTETVVIEGLVGSRKKATFVTKQRLEVSPGAAKRCWVYLRIGPSELTQEARVEIRSASGGVFHRVARPVSTGGLHGTRLSLLVAGESLVDVIPWPGELKGFSKNLEELEVQADACRPWQLPDSLLGYQLFDVVVLRDLSSQALEAAQIEALRSWVYLGGQVVFAPRGRSAAVFKSPVARVFLGDSLVEPVPLHAFVPGALISTSDDANRGSHSARLDAGTELGLSETHSYTILDPLSGRAPREIAAASAEAVADDDFGSARRLYAERPFGRGRIGLLTFDDQSHRDQASQKLLLALWAQIITWSLSGEKAQFLAQSSAVQIPAVVKALKDPAREVGVRVMVGLLGGYIVLAGPVLYLLLRRLNRLPAVIWAQPILVLLYVGVIFTTAYLTKGMLTKTRLVTIITQQAGDPIALRESFLSIFSSSEMTYRISAPRGAAYLRPIYENLAEERPTHMLRSTGGELTLEDHALAHWQEGSFSSAGIVELGGTGIELDPVESGTEGKPCVKVVNHLPYGVLEGVYYPGDNSRKGYALPPVAPGASARLTLGDPLSESPHEKSIGAFLDATTGRSSGIRIVALLDRSEEDFKIDQQTSVKKRLDYYVLLR